MTDEQLVLRETAIPLAKVPAGLRRLVVDLCRMTMGELLVLVEKVEAVDAAKGEMVRKVWNQRRDTAELRALLASLEGKERRAGGTP